jgi:hypothetical protein
VGKLMVAVVLLLAFEAAHLASAGAKWVRGSPMVSAHGNTALVTLQDGLLLAVSGNDGVGLTTIAELYNPATGQWGQTGSTNQGRNAFRAPILLRDGRVLVAAGHNEQVVDYATAELYNPTTGRWTYTGSSKTYATVH